MKYLFPQCNVNFLYVNDMSEVILSDQECLTILLVLDMSGYDALKKTREAIDYTMQINHPKRVGILVSQYNSYLSYYFYYKLRGKVTFFNSHNLYSGLFQRNFMSWLKGKTFRPMRIVNRFRDDRYGLSLKEWIALVVPLSGEKMSEISTCLKIPITSLYRMRNSALKQLEVNTYREFCQMYIAGVFNTENSHQRHAPLKSSN